jgi:hypothetical protein
MKFIQQFLVQNSYLEFNRNCVSSSEMNHGLHISITRLFHNILAKVHEVMDKSGAEAGFLRELRFPLPIYIPSALHNHLHYHPRLAQ